MTVSTTGFEVRAGSRKVRDAVELVSSMRFSISLLTVICIASVIGTVVKQGEPYSNYVNQFGPFWAEVFGAVNLYTVYSAWWFLLILAFLVLSTSLCIARNLPKIVTDLRTFKEHMREGSLKAFHHKGQNLVAESPAQAFDRVSTLLVQAGWKAKIDVRERGTMVAARKGSANKIGYIAAHSAIVLVCLGGLFDGDLIVRAQMWIQGKSVYSGGGLIRDVGQDHRLGAGNPTFRANLLVSEGSRSGTAIINLPTGVVLQELPFDIELKKFIVEFYDTGMPKLFASNIVIHDRDTGESTPVTVKVNDPAFHRGVAIYQSSFDDGGSALKLKALPMQAGGKPFEIDGTVGSTTQLKSGADTLGLEFTGLRVFNIENFAPTADGNAGRAGGTSGAVDVRKVDLASSLQAHLGSGAKVKTEKLLRNVGPSISYKLRDAAGQAREFNNYMLPIELDGQRVFLAGVRDNPSDAFRYLRIPADDADSIDSWQRLRQALTDPALRDAAAKRYVVIATPDGRPEMAAQLTATAQRALALFAGAEAADSGTTPSGGLQAISEFLEKNVPEADRERISEVLLRILNGSLFEMLNITRESAGLPVLKADEKTQAFMTQSVLSLSDSFFYPAPVLLELADFTQVQASVFQVARAPGKKLVYLGAVMLIIGVFTMLYVRERRLWIWLEPAGVDDRTASPHASPHADSDSPATKITVALSTTRRTLDGDAEFDRLKKALLKEA
ncbi:MAG: cytochrome biosis protein ResB [Rhizobacter sp.]|nr:cytochrome biosis protein ResB [Rhizobacter sp.]